MALKFSCSLSFSDSFKENEVGVYQSDTGEEYRVKYKSNVCRDLMLRIEWKIPKRVLTTVTLYNRTFKRCISSKGIVINGNRALIKLRGAFNIGNSPDYNVLCIINLIPYIKFDEVSEVSNDTHMQIESAQFPVNETCKINNKESKYNGENSEECLEVINGVKINETAEGCGEINPILKHKSQECSGDSISEGNTLTENMMMKNSNIPLLNTSTENGESVNSESQELTKENGILREYNLPVKKAENNVYESLESIALKKSEQLIDHRKVLNENFVNSIENQEMCNSNMQTSHQNISQNISDSINLLEESLEGKHNRLFNDLSGEVVLNFNEDAHKVLESENVIKPNQDTEFTMPMSHNIECTRIDNGAEAHELLVPNNVKSKINRTPEINNKVLQRHGNEINIGNLDKLEMNITDMEVDSAPKDTFENKNLIIDIDLVSPSKDSISPITSNSASLYNNSLEESTSMFSTKLPSVENESQTLSLDNDSLIPSSIDDTVTDNIMNNSAMKDNKSASRTSFSPETELIFQSLIRNLSVDNCDDDLDEVHDEVINSTDFDNQRSLKSSFASARTFPVMESQFRGLSMDMLDLLMSGSMTDAVISNGQKEVKVHRAIIFARSSILKNILTRQMKRNIENRVIVDIPTYILEDVIVFIYVGLVNIKSVKMAQDMLQVAEKYCISDLIDICSKYITE